MQPNTGEENGGKQQDEQKDGDQKDSEKSKGSDQDTTQINNGLGAVIAGFMGWSVASSRPDGQPILDREAFKNLDREKDKRRFLRWHKGQLKHVGASGSLETDIGDLPPIGFHGFNFNDRRIYGAETQK